MKSLPIGFALMLTLAGCAGMGGLADEGADSPSSPASVRADLRDASGAVKARATISEAGGGLRLRIEAAGLAPGAYGAHVHAVGRCDPSDFASAGPHWNPAARQHGKDNPQGMHKGDLPNLMVGADGRGSFEIDLEGARLSGGADALLDSDGAALVIHAKPDDYRTDPSGNSGARIACGVLN
jgi:Cu-Zn family superoxide dismutase